MSRERSLGASGKIWLVSIAAAALGWTMSAWTHQQRRAQGPSKLTIEQKIYMEDSDEHANDPHEQKRQPPRPPQIASKSRTVHAPTDDAFTDPPTPDETEGRLNFLYEMWSSAPLDNMETARTRTFFEQAFAAHDVAAQSQDVSCTGELCRCRFLFMTQRDSWALGRLRDYQDRDIVLGLPEEVSDGIAVVIYFATRDHKLPRDPRIVE